jgi:hypothetical protein
MPTQELSIFEHDLNQKEINVKRMNEETQFGVSSWRGVWDFNLGVLWDDFLN